MRSIALRNVASWVDRPIRSGETKPEPDGTAESKFISAANGTRDVSGAEVGDRAGPATGYSCVGAGRDVYPGTKAPLAAN